MSQFAADDDTYDAPIPVIPPGFPMPPGDFTAKVVEFSIRSGKPIHTDYYHDSHERRCRILCDKASNESVLFKSKYDYTSPIAGASKDAAGNYMALTTANSIYIVSGRIERSVINGQQAQSSSSAPAPSSGPAAGGGSTALTR
jgi:hypothetical protein